MIVVFTLTRDRLEFTQHCFKQLRELAGHDYRHYILDNGSTDGTKEWLKEYAKDPLNKVSLVIDMHENIGIPKAMNILKWEISQRTDTPLVVKMDNDCCVKTENILFHIAKAYAAKPELHGEWILSPRVEGINKQPVRFREEQWNGYQIGVTDIVGGLFRVVPFDIFCDYEANESLPKAYGTDGNFAKWIKERGGYMGYIENVTVEHYLTTDGQARRYPEYFVRKKKEEGR